MYVQHPWLWQFTACITDNPKFDELTKGGIILWSLGTGYKYIPVFMIFS